MNIISAYLSDVGSKRDHNEDYIWVDDNACIYIVADGLGGYEAGEIASKMAAEMVGQILALHLSQNGDSTNIKLLLTNILETANKAIYSAAQQNQQQQDMSTTLMLVLVQLPHVYICHAGDTRTYLLRNHTINRLTTDDSWLGGGKLRHVLTKAVGQEHALEPEFVELTVQPEDWLLLCSDGLWDMLPDEQILNLLSPQSLPKDYVKLLIAAANQAGGHDNISAIALKVLAN